MPMFYTIKGFLAAIVANDGSLVLKYMEHKRKDEWLAHRYDGNSGLHMAVRHARFSMIQLLAKHGFSVNDQNAKGLTPLDLALRNNDAARAHRLAKVLLDLGADANASGTNDTPLKQSVARGYALTSELLIGKGVDINAGNPLQAALNDQSMRKVALLLLQKGATLESAGAAPVLVAAMRGTTELIPALLEKGADIAATDGSGRTALHRAVEFGQSETLKWLLENSSLDVNSQDGEGRTPLHRAVQSENYAMIAPLLSAGARPDIADNLQMTPVQWAVQKNYAPAIRQLEAKDHEQKSKAATPLTAGVNMLPADEAETWVRLGQHQVARVGIYPAVGRRLTEIFNFETRGIMIISENLKTGAESITPLTPFDSVSEAALEKALSAFRELGGTADNSILGKGAPKRLLPGPQGS